MVKKNDDTYGLKGNLPSSVVTVVFQAQPLLEGISLGFKWLIQVNNISIGLNFLALTKEENVKNRIEIKKFEFVPEGSKLALMNCFENNTLVFNLSTKEEAEHAANLFSATSNVNLVTPEGEIINVYVPSSYVAHEFNNGSIKISDISPNYYQALSFAQVPVSTISRMTKFSFVEGSRFSSDTVLIVYVDGDEHSVYEFGQHNPVILVNSSNSKMAQAALPIDNFSIDYSFKEAYEDTLDLEPVFVKLYFGDVAVANEFQALALADGGVDVTLDFGNGNLRLIALEVNHG